MSEQTPKPDLRKIMEKGLDMKRAFETKTQAFDDQTAGKGMQPNANGEIAPSGTLNAESHERL